MRARDFLNLPESAPQLIHLHFYAGRHHLLVQVARAPLPQFPVRPGAPQKPDRWPLRESTRTARLPYALLGTIRGSLLPSPVLDCLSPTLKRPKRPEQTRSPAAFLNQTFERHSRNPPRLLSDSLEFRKNFSQVHLLTGNWAQRGHQFPPPPRNPDSLPGGCALYQFGQLLLGLE
jgi:hypothetical protein